jgi:ATP-dependent DNA helicase RecG
MSSSDDFGFTFTFLRNKEFLNDKINEIDKKIIAEMNDNKYVTIPELAIKIGKSEPIIHRHIDALVSKGIVKRVGSRKTGYWEIK